MAKVLDSVRTEGLVATYKKVTERLATPQPLGYSLAGTIIDVGEDWDGLHVGMAVACGGASASHAEVVSVPKNLVVPIPHGVPMHDACYATLASIPLHAIRLGEVAIGDRVLVIGLGLMGQLAARLCAGAGARVFGVDPDRSRADLALHWCAEQVDTRLDRSTALQILDWSRGRGADVVLITAGGADSRPLGLAGEAARDRAKVVVVGAVGLDVPRESFYEKELRLVVSRSYGPGRYDPEFEEKGYAYPPGYVPWTERRNMEEILDLLQCGRLPLDGLRGATIPFERAPEAYDLLRSDSPPISIVLDYGSAKPHAVPGTSSHASQAHAPHTEPSTHLPRSLRVSFIGMGNFASSYLLPAAKQTAESLEHVVTQTPLKAEHARKRGGFRSASTDGLAAIEDPNTDVVFVATRHDTHARWVEAALRAHKAVFVEKPLALTARDYERIATLQRATQGRLMVGFNRRFAPATMWALDALGSNRTGLRITYRINAGALPPHHWLLDPDTGGGRLIGEGCHFVDYACFLADASPVSIDARALDAAGESFHIEIAFSNGASCGIDYLSRGDASLAKERIEIHRSGLSIVIDDFRTASLHRGGKRAAMKRWKGRDKGHQAEVRAFLEAVVSGAPTPIPEEESLRSTALTLAAAMSLREGRAIHRDEWPR
ncbi:MAG TPA: bi-domain-containing oxidoreductase [Candidatus Eisenbacteria bacterium]|nr:bi-domain-containing oxidoreductase [Candidatus Eisenbacteria bacterium]